MCMAWDAMWSPFTYYAAFSIRSRKNLINSDKEPHHVHHGACKSLFSDITGRCVNSGWNQCEHFCAMWSQYVFGLSGCIYAGQWVLGTYLKEPLRNLILHCPGLNRWFPFRPSHFNVFSVKTMVVWDDSIPQEIDTSPGHASRVPKAFPGPAAASLCLSSHSFNGDVAPPD